MTCRFLIIIPSQGGSWLGSPSVNLGWSQAAFLKVSPALHWTPPGSPSSSGTVSAHPTLCTPRLSFQTSVCAQCWAPAQSPPVLLGESSPKALPSLYLFSMKMVSHPLLCPSAPPRYPGGPPPHVCLSSPVLLTDVLPTPFSMLTAPCSFPDVCSK